MYSRGNQVDRNILLQKLHHLTVRWWWKTEKGEDRKNGNKACPQHFCLWMMEMRFSVSAKDELKWKVLLRKETRDVCFWDRWCRENALYSLICRSASRISDIWRVLWLYKFCRRGPSTGGSVIWNIGISNCKLFISYENDLNQKSWQHAFSIESCVEKCAMNAYYRLKSGVASIKWFGQTPISSFLAEFLANWYRKLRTSCHVTSRNNMTDQKISIRETRAVEQFQHPNWHDIKDHIHMYISPIAVDDQDLVKIFIQKTHRWYASKKKY